jgi:hypothetical protein
MASGAAGQSPDQRRERRALPCGAPHPPRRMHAGPTARTWLDRRRNNARPPAAVPVLTIDMQDIQHPRPGAMTAAMVYDQRFEQTFTAYEVDDARLDQLATSLGVALSTRSWMRSASGSGSNLILRKPDGQAPISRSRSRGRASPRRRAIGASRGVRNVAASLTPRHYRARGTCRSRAPSAYVLS